MYVYIDETGNTGPNMFDKNQPFFAAMALMSKTDFDNSYRAEYLKILKKLSIKDLHARSITFPQYDQACAELANILHQSEIQFSYTYVDKRMYVITMLFDTIFDQGNNKAVPWTAYWVETFRKTLLLNFIYLVGDDNVLLESFWKKCFFAKTSMSAKNNFLIICDQLLAKIKVTDLDQRTKTIFHDAFTWMKENHESIYYHINTTDMQFNHLPNATFLAGLMTNIDSQWLMWNTSQCHIYHDRQNEFQNALEFIHKYISAESTPKMLPYPFIETPSKFQSLSGTNLNFLSSSSSYGIQTTDICLYVLAKYFKQKEFSKNEQNLFSYITNNIQSNFVLTYEQLSEQVQIKCASIMSKDISPENLLKGKKFLELQETQRKKIMETYSINKNTQS